MRPKVKAQMLIEKMEQKIQSNVKITPKEVREFYKKEFEPSDVRKSIVAAIAVKVQEPVFESQTKTKLGLSQ